MLSPTSTMMLHQLPPGAPHPLYDDDPKYADLRTQFVLDYLLLDRIDVHDPRMTQPQGLTVTNLAGRDLTFKTDAEGV